MNAHDRLERQLEESVRGASVVPARWWRRRVGLLLVPVVLAGGAAGATAALTTGGPDVEKDARSLELRALRETFASRACGPVDLVPRARFVEGLVPREVVAALPAMGDPARPVPIGADAALARTGPGRRVVRSSFLLTRFPGGLRVAAGVTEGAAGSRLREPVACLGAREAVVTSLVTDAEDPARRRALGRLRDADDVRPGAQELSLWYWREGTGGSSGTSAPLRAGRAVPTGILGSGSSTYVGIARSGTTRIDVRSRRTGRRLRLIIPQTGLFAFRLPRRTGPVTLLQRGADGRVLARSGLRGG